MSESKVHVRWEDADRVTAPPTNDSCMEIQSLVGDRFESYRHAVVFLRDHFKAHCLELSSDGRKRSRDSYVIEPDFLKELRRRMGERMAGVPLSSLARWITVFSKGGDGRFGGKGTWKVFQRASFTRPQEYLPTPEQWDALALAVGVRDGRKLADALKPVARRYASQKWRTKKAAGKS